MSAKRLPPFRGKASANTLLRMIAPALGLLLSGIAPALRLSAQELESKPLVLTSAPAGETLFTELSPERTGIVTTNRYDDPLMWTKLHREYHVGAIGTGVTVGDYDGDGLPDVYIVSKVESGRLFRNLGDWRFEDVTEVAGVADHSGVWKQGAAFVDVDNDGFLDLYICRFGAPNQLFMNQGDGTFREEAEARGLATADASGMANFADYDRDGWLDVYLQTNLLDATASPEGQRDYLFRNDGDGTFTDVTDAAGILEQPTQGHSATWWDQNEDGWLDLYVANDFDPPDFLYRNNGDGTFTNVLNQAVSHTPFSSMGADLGDVDGDGLLDFLVADMAGTTYEMTQRGLADSRSRSIAVQNERVDEAVQVLYNALYLNTGTNRSLEAAYLAGVEATDWTWAVRFEDLDNDGRVDLFVTNGTDREQNNIDMLTRRLSTVSPNARIAITKTSPVLKQANLVYVNRGGLRFEEVGAAWGLDHVGASFGAAFGDFDGDGDLDLIYTNYQEPAKVFRNDSQTGNRVIVELRGRSSNRFGMGARLEAKTTKGIQVRQLVSARGYLSTSEPVAHFGFGEEEVIERLLIKWPSGHEQVFENLATGRRYIVMEPGEAAQLKRVEANDTRSLFAEVSESLGLSITQREEWLEGTVYQPLLPRRFNRRGPGIAVGDLDGDGVDEIALAGTALDGPKVFQRDGLRYQTLDTGAAGATPAVNDGPPLIFDANGDGLNDLLFTGGGAALPAEEPEYEPRLWINDGSGGFRPADDGMLPSLPISVGASVAADFDRDGSLDLFLGGRLLPGFYPEPAYSAFLMQRGGQLKDETSRFAPELGEVGLATSALATDVDGDGWIDLVVALEWGGVRFFRNMDGEGLEDVSEEWGFDSTGTGFWTSIAAADFNGDGRLDYALGNLGLNTIYEATQEHPMRLFAGKFAGGSETQLALAYDDGGVLRPVASRGELASKIPEVLKRFPSNDDFAAAALGEILGEAELAKAEVYEASQLQSGVLLSQPSGGYAFAPLPRYAQIAPVQGMVASDFDGDGFADLLLAHNDYSPIPAHGRFDSGLGWFLRGDGSGGFSHVPLSESGWVVPGNAKALALVDLDGGGRPGVVVTRNNQASLAFLLAEGEGVARVALRLRGRGGNPDAIGARVEVESGGRTLQLFEVSAGGGFSSQSSATVFLALPIEQAREAKLRIRWPSGAATELDFPSAGGFLAVEEE